LNQDQAAAIVLKLIKVREGRRRHIRTFRKGGRVFATINELENRSCLRLSSVDQDVFCRLLPEHIYRVPNKNGSYGWTLFMIKHIPKGLFKDAVECAYGNIEHIIQRRRSV
jgi:hypothetical protein